MIGTTEKQRRQQGREEGQGENKGQGGLHGAEHGVSFAWGSPIYACPRLLQNKGKSKGLTRPRPS